MVSAAQNSEEASKDKSPRCVHVLSESLETPNPWINVSCSFRGASEYRVMLKAWSKLRVLIEPVYFRIKVLLWSFNSNVIKALITLPFLVNFAEKKITSFLPLGKKATRSFKKRDFALIPEFLSGFLVTLPLRQWRSACRVCRWTSFFGGTNMDLQGLSLVFNAIIK